MAYYAFLDENNIVTHVIPGIDETETIEGLDPETWYSNFVGQPCKRTSYNTYGGQRADGGVPYRLNYAGIGFEYREDLDGFVGPQPDPSWTLDETTGLWEPPPAPDLP
jgi:hypothetical protein